MKERSFVMKAKQMYHLLVMALVPFALLAACQSYQLGGTLEPREVDNAKGVFFSGDALEGYVESTAIVFFPDKDEKNWVLGYDYNLKYPLNFARNYLSIFPIVGFEGRYTLGGESDGTETSFSGMGMGIKFGGGFDISPTPAFFIRGKAMYVPDFTAFLNSKPGFRFSLSLGYRTDDDPVRRGFGSAASSYRGVLKQEAVNELIEMVNTGNRLIGLTPSELKEQLDSKGLIDLTDSYGTPVFIIFELFTYASATVFTFTDNRVSEVTFSFGKWDSKNETHKLVLREYTSVFDSKYGKHKTPDRVTLGDMADNVQPRIWSANRKLPSNIEALVLQREPDDDLLSLTCVGF